MSITRWLRSQKAEWLLGNGFYHFCKESQIIPDIQEQPHREMCAEMECMEPKMRVGRRQRRRLYLAPRYTYKSSLLVAFIVYLILKYPDIAILLIRSTREAAAQMLLEVKGVFTTNQIILDTFGDLSLQAPIWAENQIVVNTRTRVNKDPTVFAAGIDVSTTGMHPDCVFPDDIVTRENCDSIRLMALARMALQAIYPLLPPWGTMLVTGTRWSNIDTYGWILERNARAIENGQEPGYEVYIRSAYMQSEDGTQHLFFPALLSAEFLEQARRDLEPRYFASWYYNQTYEEGLKPFTNLQFFDGDYSAQPFHNVQLTGERFANEQVPLYMALIVDPALTASASSDSFGVVVVGFDANGDWLIFEGLEIRKLPSYAGDDIAKLIMDYEPDMLLIESANADVTMVARLQDTIRDSKLSTAVVSYSALQDEARGQRGKPQRIGALEPLFRQGKIWIRRGACAELVRQLDLYPGIEHDDVIDALAMARKAFSVAPKVEKVNEDFGTEKPDSWHERVGWQAPGARNNLQSVFVGLSTPGLRERQRSSTLPATRPPLLLPPRRPQ